MSFLSLKNLGKPYLVSIQSQINYKTNPKHIYRSLRVLLNSTLARNEFRSFQTRPIHKLEGSKPYIYTFYTKTRQIPYKNIRLPYKTIAFHTFDLLFSFFLPSSLLFFFFFSLSLLFSSPKNERPLILSPFCLFSQDQNGIFLAF